MSEQELTAREDVEALAELSDVLAEHIYEAYRLGKYGRQEYLPDWHDEASREHVPGVEVRRATGAVRSWLADFAEGVRAAERERLAACHPDCALGPGTDHHGSREYRCMDKDGDTLPFPDEHDGLTFWRGAGPHA